MPSVAVTARDIAGYTPVPLEGLASATPLPFPLYLRTAADSWILYRDVAAALNEEHLGRLHAEGIAQLYVRDRDRAAYFRRVEGALDSILLDRNTPVERRADVLHGVAIEVAQELLAAPPAIEGVRRAQRVLAATSALMLRESQGFQALRRVLDASQGLATHSLTVGFLAMGLARQVLGGDTNQLLTVGLAGLLHDVGRCGHEDLEHDPEHTERGHDYLRALNLPKPVLEAALYHHERFDGSGFPTGLAGARIPEVARIVGLANTFDKVYSGQQPRVSVFDALRILAQAYKGCFDDRLAQAFVRLFRA